MTNGMQSNYWLRRGAKRRGEDDQQFIDFRCTPKETNATRLLLHVRPAASVIPANAGSIDKDKAAELRQKGMAIMLTTHYMEEAQELCDRVAIIDQGKIVAMDTPTQLVNDLKESSVESERRDGILTLEDVFIHLTARRLQE